jgi:hypothetical protein
LFDVVIDKERSLLYGPSRLEQLQYIATGGMCFIQCPFSFLLSPFLRRHCRQEESKLLTNPAVRSACETSSLLADLFLPLSLYQSPSLEDNRPSARQKISPHITKIGLSLPQLQELGTCPCSYLLDVV